MNKNNTSEDKQRKLKMPRISKLPRIPLKYRLVLYSITILFSVLSLAGAIFECYPEIANIILYVLTACSLTTSCYYLTMDIQYLTKNVIKPAIAGNSLTNIMAKDYRFRTVLLAVPGVSSNVIYAVFNGVTGIISHSAWFISLSAYYILLSVMRIAAVRQERQISRMDSPKECMKREITIYQQNSTLFIVMSIVLGGMVILLEHSLGGKTYPEITIYAVAAYTFYKITLSIVHVIKAGRLQSPLLMIIRKIGCIDALVSILILQTALLAAFSVNQDRLIKVMNGLTGTAICLFGLGIGIQGMCSAKKMVRNLEV